MVLSKEDAELFYELWFPLLNYANRKYRINSKLKEMHFDQKFEPRDVKAIADRIWENVGIIDEYLSQNDLPEEHKSIISGRKNRILDSFIIERHLKKGSVFINMKTAEVYLVNGIFSTWEEIICGSPLPIALNAVLIPFKNVIISDGLIMVFPMAFGRNITAEYKKIYMDAKNAGKIHKTL